MRSARPLRLVAPAPRRSGITAAERYLAGIAALAFPVGVPSPPTGCGFGLGRLAAVLGVSGPATREMLLRLAADGLAEDHLRGRWALTPAGAERAGRVVRRQRIVVRFLVEELACSVAEAYDEGLELAVGVSDRAAERMRVRLGAATRDPNGWPFDPDEDRTEAPALVRATALRPGEESTVVRMALGPRPSVVAGPDRSIRLTPEVADALWVAGSGGPATVGG